MKTLPPCILYTQDEELALRLARITSSQVVLQAVTEAAKLEECFVQLGDTLLIADIRAPNCLEILSEIKVSWPRSVIIVMGADRSDPMLAAEWLDPFATTGLEPARREFQLLLKHAGECFRLRQKTRLLEEELGKLKTRHDAPKPEPRSQLAKPLENFSKAQRNFDNLEKLFESVVDGLVDTTRVTRAGIFIKPAASDNYSYQAGTRCLQTTRELMFSSSDPFVIWLETHLHMVSRQTLDNIQDIEERALLKYTMDSLGAEVILPLHAAGSLQGWIFVGRPATGIPFDITGLEELAGLADHISTTLEKALLYEETALQKALAGTVLHSIPFGIVACDNNAIVRWFNSTARDILLPDIDQVLGERVETLGSHIADMLRSTLQNMKGQTAREWEEPRTKRTLSAETRCLMDEGTCVGVMMMLHDTTGAKLLQEKEDQLERAAFWTDLAASMSHEIRNPLVAIKTFSQLLPERYEDAEFRAEFGEQVTAEVDKLNNIIDKINRFADHPPLVLTPLDIRRPIESAVTRLQSELDHDNLRIHLSADDSAHRINGDSNSLEECFYHLLRNAAENLNNKKGSNINLVVKTRTAGGSEAKVLVIITDNGSGIDESVRDKIFSPFSTVKARGLGLGLPIAKRSVIDHNGQLDIESTEQGTSLRISLPALDEE